ncbi:MAG TPA: response regulator transcription factor [Candidatus Cybelea sp.]|nr:response regulator transcription factor [Candidatus Cybelea sp.]
MPLRLLIVDDHDVVRLGLRKLADLHARWEVCGEAGNGENAIAKVEELAPDVVILDVAMPGMNGFETAMRIRRMAPATKIILFSIQEVPATADQVGADAFVSKASGLSNLVATVERLARG